VLLLHQDLDLLPDPHQLLVLLLLLLPVLPLHLVLHPLPPPVLLLLPALALKFNL
jgi:hypothetical protein